jgi:diguanylate cyclase (GGDEF)-like protein/PAS domain S-box-containing protein
MTHNVLLIQGGQKDAQVVRAALANHPDQEYRVEWVNSGALGLERLALLSAQPRDGPIGIAAILVDLRLPDFAGLEIVDRLFALAPHTPLVVLCSLEDEVLAKAAIRRGAQDFLRKEQLNSYMLPKTLAAAIERAAITEALLAAQERAQVTLDSIGDAVISTDVEGRVTYLNLVAERLTGWRLHEAMGLPLQEVFRIVDAVTRTTVPNPMAMATEGNVPVGLPTACILIRRDAVETAIEDSAAPIHDRLGRVTGAVMVFHDVSTARALTLKLAYIAQHDPLTGLPNRALLSDRLDQAISQARRHDTALAMLYLDLDRFKHINDSLGHLVGDQLLQTVALRLTECVRATDTVCRLGGDEFVILLSEVAHTQDAAGIADKILQSLRQPQLLGDQELQVTASIGIVVHPGDGTAAEALLQNADSAMYEAKNRGRNNYQFYRSELNSSASASASERLSIENDLRHAIERRELTLHYQPIVNLRTGAVAGVEALLRWQHPALGLMLPDRFLSIAEESGLIVPIGHWMLRKACAQAKSWHDGGLSNLRLAVNISAMELRSKQFVAGVGASLAATGFDPRWLEVEITENFLMQDSKSTSLVLGALKGLGICLALDDFGTGYSSLSHLRRFPIDTVKVDRSFVHDLTENAGNASAVSAIINMGRSLRLRVVAEGVEAVEQLEFLQEHGCAEAQGHHFSRPLPAADFAGWIRTRSAYW